MSLPTLSYSNPEIGIALCEYIGDGVTLVADGTATEPIPLARPAEDDLIETGVKAFQISDTAYGFDVLGGASNNQGITITFTSAVAGYVCVAVRAVAATTFGDCNADIAFGRFTSSANYTGLWFGATLNATSTAAASYWQGYISGSVTMGPARDNNAWGTFNWWWAPDATATEERTLFPVVVGTNTLTLSAINAKSLGLIIEGVWIGLIVNHSDFNRMPRMHMETSTPVAYNTAALKAAVAGTGRVLIVGDSLVVRNYGWGRMLRDKIATTYPLGGLGQMINAGDSSNFANDFGAGSSAAWATAGSHLATWTKSSGASYTSTAVPWLYGYKWTDGQTAAATFTFTGTSVRLVWENISTGAAFTTAIDGGATTNRSSVGTDGTFSYCEYTGLSNAQHTLTIAKANGGGELRLAYLINSDATGWVPLRMGRSGLTIADLVVDAAGATSFRSLCDALGVTQVVFGGVNTNGFKVGGTGHDQGDYIPSLILLMTALAGETAIGFTYVDLYGFSNATYSTRFGDFAASLMANTGFNLNVFDLAYFDRFPLAMGWLSFTAWMGASEMERYGKQTAFFAASAVSSVTYSISDYHTSTAGATAIGNVLGAALLGETMPDSPYCGPALLYRQQVKANVGNGRLEGSFHVGNVGATLL